MDHKMMLPAGLACRLGMLCIFYTYFLSISLFASVKGAITSTDAKSVSVAEVTSANRSALPIRPFFAPQGVRGPLKVSANGRYFVYADGTPFFYLGDTAWELFHRLNREEADAYLQDRANKGFNVIQAVVLAEQDGLRIPNAYGQVPFQNLDPTKPNEAYFQHVDYIVNKAEALGMFTGMLPTWGDKWNNWWGIGPMVFNQSNARTYGAWLANRYKNKPIIWILGGDRVPTKPEHYGVIRAMAEGIRSVVGNSQLITFHPEGKKSSSAFFHSDQWLSFNTYQSGHYAYDFDDAYQLAADNYRRSPVKPSLNIEPLYEDHPVNWQTSNWFNDYDVRQAAYWSVFAGGAGHAYGNHNIWQFYNPNGKYSRISNARTPWKDALRHAGAGQMMHLRKLMEARKMLTLVPDQGLIASGQGGGADYMAAARGEDFAFIYVSTGQKVTVSLSKVPGNEVRGWWYDPRTGKATHIGKYTSEGNKDFDAPGNKGRGNDWVLILDDAAKNYAAPDGTQPPRDEPANEEPVVSITQPANQASFDANATITVQANASDKNGSVSKVEFYNGNTKLGEAAAAPWSYSWKEVKAGNYAITAKATDNNGATATSAAVNITVKAPTTPPANPTPADPAVAKIMPLGNSITQSYAAYNSYRRPLWHKLKAAGYKVDFVGSQTKNVGGGPANPDFDMDHEGHWGWRADQLLEGIGGWANTYRPDILLLHAGTNDMFQQNDVKSTINELGQIIDRVRAANPKVTILLAKLILPTEKDGRLARIHELNKAIPALATSKNTTLSRVILVDQATGFNGATDTYDGVHTNVSGENKMADRWFDALATVLPKANTAPNKAPVVTLTSPDSEATFTAAANVTLESSVSDQDGRVTKVEYYNGSTKLGEATSAPWRFTWQNVKEGKYSITARATDDDLATTTSAAVNITVKAPAPAPNKAPVVSVKLSGATTAFTAPATISFEAAASDEDGQIRKVEFFAGDDKIGEKTTAPWNFTWKEASEGEYAITAKATDDDGATAASSAVNIKVTPAPVPNKAPEMALTAPENNASVEAGAAIAITGNASDEDGQISKVEFFAGNTKLGEDTSAPWSFTWKDAKEGKYTITAKATDNDGATATSAAVNITVEAVTPAPVPNKAPEVALTAPENNASVEAGAAITITGNASDGDGSISKVEFYNGTTKLGEDTSAPWSFTWKDAKEGKYTITAKATDNDGATATSAAVNITVKVTAPDPEPEPVPPVAEGDFYRAINLNGTALKIDDNNWQGSNAPNYTYSATPASGLNVGVKPTTDADRAAMLRTFIYSRNLKLTLSAVPDGKYDVYLYIWEDNYPETFDVSVEGKTVKNSHNSGSAGTWSKLGPYTVTVADNTIDVAFTGGYANLSGIEVWKSKATDPVPTEPTEPEPAPPVATCSATGTILEEIWKNVPGITVSDIPVGKSPDASSQLTLFEAPAQAGNNYGRRIRGYICPPTTGNYTFYIASDDHSELWLSTDSTAGKKVKIAEVVGWARKGEWEKYPSQRSQAVALQAGRKYYIEALHKDGDGGDNLAVGWELPGGAMERPIPGARLSSFVPASNVASCEGTGGLLREFWADAPGCGINSIPLHRPATASSLITSFEGPINIAHNYGARIRGYICPPATGDYTFWLASDDSGELWISTDEDPTNKTRIAFVDGWTNPREWEKYPTQKSATVRLEIGRRYYVEVLHKDCESGDYVGVGWQMPDGQLERPIAGNRLIPFHSEAVGELVNLQRAEVYPNPASVSATLRFYSMEDHEANIVVTNSLALQVLTLKKQAKAGSNEVTLELGNLPRGVYYINIDNQYAEKLIIAR